MADSMSTELGKMDLDKDGDSTELEMTPEGLIERGRLLHEEVETFIAAVLARQNNRVQSPVEFQTLRNDVKGELVFLQKLSNVKDNEQKTQHYMASSNLPYYEALWSAAKRSYGLQSFRRYFYWDRRLIPAGPHSTKESRSTKRTVMKSTNTAALVDIVAAEGTEWIRVSTVPEKRLLFDLAKLGWVNDSDSDDDMPDVRSRGSDDDDMDDQIDIVKNAYKLAKAARASPVHGRPPKVRFVLTRVVSGKTKAIDMIIDKIRATGAIVQCANEIPSTLSLQDVLPHLIPNPSRTLTDTLNIDCTILLALISEISHRACPVLDWYPNEVRGQIAAETENHLLQTQLYPTIGSRSMVCTQEAADQMNLIVQTLATDTEKLRADLLLRQGDRKLNSPEQLVAEWKSMSDYDIPEGFRLPINVESVNINNLISALPSAATKVASELGLLNQSIFLYGWSRGITTLSGNLVRARQIETILNEHGLAEGEAIPNIWRCSESRSLIAKPGKKHGAHKKAELL